MSARSRLRPSVKAATALLMLLPVMSAAAAPPGREKGGTPAGPSASQGRPTGPVITTVAGQSPAGYSGDGGQAAQSHMNEPRMLAFDSAGNYYIADTFNQVIRKVDAAGVITTIAGHATGFVPRSEADCRADFKGDGGPATKATLSCPHSVAVDAGGIIYIADSANSAIRKIDATGTITTVAGRGGLGGDAGDGGPATAAKIQGPKGIVLDGQGGLLIADSGNDKIRRLDLASGTIETIAGTGDPGGDGDGGPATAAELLEPRTLALGPDGSLLVAEPKAHRIRRIAPDGTISVLAGTGGAGYSGDGGRATTAKLNFPRGVGVDGAGNIFIADSMNQRIRRVGVDGIITTVAGSGARCYFSERNTCGDGGPATEAGFATPRAVEVSASGDLYVADTFNERIRRLEAAAEPVRR